jgi:HlyD family secretion protein/adhesin transport system membrane fusion protein
MIDENGWNYRIVVFPIMLFSALFIAWTIFTDVDEVVRGSGKVIPSSQSKVLQHLEGGIVEDIFVKEGQEVKKGDAIYRLKNANSQADSNKKEISLLALKAKRERLKAQASFGKLVFSKEVEDAMMSEDEANIFKQEMQNFSDELSALKDRLSQSKLEKKQKSSRLANLRAEYKTAQENLRIIETLLKKGAASKQQYLAELSKKQSLVTSITDIKSALPIMDEKISEAKNKIKSFKSETQSKWLKKLSEVETKIKELSEEKHAQSDREERKVVVSPVNGLVKKLYFHTIGGIIKSGDRIAEITPIDDNLVIEAKIKTNDRGQVLIGQDVSIEITAYNYAKFGLLEGELISISPDSFTDKNGGDYYQVKVQATKREIAEDKPIMPGMVANINILTGKKSIFEYILKPLKDISKNALHEK